MRPRDPYTVPAVARHSWGLALAVPEVVAQRVMRMWMAGTPLSQRDRDEFHRMYAEKFAAFYESWNAMALEMFRVSLTLGLFPCGRSPRATAERRCGWFPRVWLRSIAALRRTRSGFDAPGDRSRLTRRRQLSSARLC